MANSERVPDDVMKEIADGPAGSKDYLTQKKRVLANFMNFVVDIEKDGRDLVEIVKDKQLFETFVKNYFFGIRVPETKQDKKTGKVSKTGRNVPPKMGYAKNIKAVLFGVFVREFKVSFTIFIWRGGASPIWQQSHV